MVEEFDVSETLRMLLFFRERRWRFGRAVSGEKAEREANSLRSRAREVRVFDGMYGLIWVRLFEAAERDRRVVKGAARVVIYEFEK